MDLKVFVDTEPDLRLIRRIRRDVIKRGRTPDSVITQYEATVRPMHLEFVEPSKRYADLVVPEGGYNRVAVDLVVARSARSWPSGECGPGSEPMSLSRAPRSGTAARPPRRSRPTKTRKLARHRRAEHAGAVPTDAGQPHRDPRD